VENDFGVHSEMVLFCPDDRCQSEDFDLISIESNPCIEKNSFGELKKYIAVKRCKNCGLKYWHHATDEYIEFCKDVSEEMNK